MKHLSSFPVWVIEYCYCGGSIDTYEIHTDKDHAKNRLEELKKDAIEGVDQYWIKKTIAYK
jgi:hypothetical protein